MTSSLSHLVLFRTNDEVMKLSELMLSSAVGSKLSHREQSSEAECVLLELHTFTHVKNSAR